METETRRFEMPPGHSSTVAAQLVQYFKSEDGQFVADDEIKSRLGYDIAVGQEHYAQSLRAIRRVLKDTGIRWVRVPASGGLARVTAKMALELAETAARHVGRTSRREVSTLKGIDLATIDETDRSVHLALCAQHGTLASFSRGRTVKAIEARGAYKPPPLKDLLAGFVKPKKLITEDAGGDG